MKKSFLLANNSQGIYAAQHILKTVGSEIQGLSIEDKKILLYGPTHEQYKDTVPKLFNTGVVLETEDKGCLHIDQLHTGEWWAIHPDEFEDFYGELTGSEID